MAHLGSAIETTFWFIDSGCTEHMCQDRSAFFTFRDLAHENRHVQGIGGSLLQVRGIGDIVISIQGVDGIIYGILQGVIYVPDLGRNLFSTYVAAQRKMYSLLTDTGCQLIENGKVVLHGTIYHRLYRLLFNVVKPETTCLAFAASSFDIPNQKGNTQSIDTWHRRLAHISHRTIRSMVSSGMVDGLFLEGGEQRFCPGCAYGKQHRHHFPANDPRTRASAPEDLVHTDLCGPLPVPSIGGSRYFSLFKDDSTGYRLVYCIKTKPESLRCFMLYCAQLERETGHTVKIIRSDRGSEYTNKAFRDYLQEKGIG